MATSAFIRRRALSLSSYILHNHKPPASSTPSLPTPPRISISSPLSQNPRPNPNPNPLTFPSQLRGFRSSTVSLSARARYDDDDSKISPDEILFEGCDYKHWLITMDFPKDPAPSREEMIETYVQTAAKVVGSVEEAKKKIYACSTTTYNGFQVEVSEEESEKFKGLPGVVFVLPDSYLDPVNKEYGGDKYINGTIIPRAPPVQFGRTGGRFNDRNRDFNRPNRPGGPYQQGNSTYDNQRSMQGDGRNYGPPQNPPPQQNYGPPRSVPAQQNYGPPGVGERRDAVPMSNSSAERGNFQGDRRDPMPPYQGNFNQAHGENSYPRAQRGFPAVETSVAPPEQNNFGAGNRNFASPQGGGFGQGTGGNYGQGAGGNYGQGAGGNYGQGAGGNYGQGAGGNYGQGAGGNYGQGAVGNYGQGAGGNYGQGAGRNVGGPNSGQGAGGNHGQGVGGNYGQGVGGNYGQGAGRNFGQGVGGDYGHGGREGSGQGLRGVAGQATASNYGNGYSEPVENQKFQPGEPINTQQGQQMNYAATGHSGTEHGRY